MPLNLKNAHVLVLAPHTDDAELCCGATLCHWVDTYDAKIHVVNCALATGASRQEAEDAALTLGATWVDTLDFTTRRFPEQRQEILELFRTLYLPIDFDIVMIPSTTDTHQDHIVVAQEAFRVFKFKTILSWETPWNMGEFAPNYFSCVTPEAVDGKLEAVSKYVSQSTRPYFDPDYLRSWARFRGGQVNQQYAEVFQVVREISL